MLLVLAGLLTVAYGFRLIPKVCFCNRMTKSVSKCSPLLRVSTALSAREEAKDESDIIDGDDEDSEPLEFDDDAINFELDNSENTKLPLSSRASIDAFISRIITNMNLTIRKTSWFANRVEIIVAKQVVNGTEEDVCPNASELEKAHRDIYTALETTDASLVQDYEVILASPGIDDELRSPRDFISFQGFPVIVTTTELYKKKTQFEGTLQERDEEHVVLSLKGRIVKIPRNLVAKVELPKPKFEPNDMEIRKLR